MCENDNIDNIEIVDLREGVEKRHRVDYIDPVMLLSWTGYTVTIDPCSLRIDPRSNGPLGIIRVIIK